MAQRKAAGWAITNAESVYREAAPYRDMPDARRFELAARVSVSALRVAMSADPEVLSRRVPLPASSVAALARLRREYRERRDG